MALVYAVLLSPFAEEVVFRGLAIGLLERRAGWPLFYADAHTAALIPAAASNVWTVEIVPGSRFAYGLRREGTDRLFRVEFDLRAPVAPPPPPWGH